MPPWLGPRPRCLVAPPRVPGRRHAPAPVVDGHAPRQVRPLERQTPPIKARPPCRPPLDPARPAKLRDAPPRACVAVPIPRRKRAPRPVRWRPPARAAAPHAHGRAPARHGAHAVRVKLPPPAPGVRHDHGRHGPHPNPQNPTQTPTKFFFNRVGQHRLDWLTPKSSPVWYRHTPKRSAATTPP